MMSQPWMGKDVWSIVLAGGEGEEVQPLVLQWLRRHRPKQYCTFVGRRSMFEHTVDRAVRIATPERTVVVAARHHHNDTREQLSRRPIGKLIYQPTDRDTTASIFLPLSYVWARDPQALVVLQPSDHFIYPEGRFLRTVIQTLAAVATTTDRLLLLGAQPDRLETEYGWIERGSRLSGSPGYPVHAVSSFLERPDAAQADAALRAGSLWNTLIVTARVETLWQAGWACFPDIMPQFERVAAAWRSANEDAVIEEVYRHMPPYNFSSALLQRLPDRVAVMEMTDTLWSDWGKAERIVETIRRIGKTPAFPLECLDRPYIPHPIPQRTSEVLATAPS